MNTLIKYTSPEFVRILVFLWCAARFRLIGSGLQYFVFSIGGGRVRKCERPALSQFLLFVRWYGFSGALKRSNIRRANEDRSQVNAIISSIWIRKYEAVFGFPERTLCGYTQQLAVPFGSALIAADYVRRTRLLGDCIQLTETMLSLDLFDKAMNPHINYGIDLSGNCICLDLGELSISKPTLTPIIAHRLWRNKAFWRQLDSSESSTYEAFLVPALMSWEQGARWHLA